MKRQELDQFRQKSAQELRKDLASARRELVEGRLKSKQGSMTNVRAIGHISTKIAQLETLMHLKES